MRDQVTRKEQLLLELAEAQVQRKPDDAKVDALVAEFGRRYPNDPEAYQLRCERLMKKGKTEEVVQEFQELIKANPNYAIAYNYLGYYAARAGDFAKAEDYLKRYRFLAPEQANPYDSLGEIYIHFGRYDEAEQSFKKALSIKPDFWPSVAHLGTLEVARGNYLAAAEHYRRSAENTVGDSERFDMLVPAFYCLTLAGKGEEALAEFQKLASEIRVGGTEAERQAFDRRTSYAKVALLARAGHVQEARAAVDDVLKAARVAVPPSDKEKVIAVEREETNILGILEFFEGRFEDAAAHIAKGLELTPPGSVGFSYFPGHELRRVYLAKALRQLGKPAEAEEALKPVLSHNPRFAAAAQELSAIRGEQPPEAVARAGAGS
jgi:tetratricopeptide (TPR) repeat protein